jgi:hypothetical protein
MTTKIQSSWVESSSPGGAHRHGRSAYGVAERPCPAATSQAVSIPAPDTTIIGFKEIAWAMGRLPAMLAFARAVFPGARFVLNTRNLTDVAQSKWWARNPNALAELQSMEKQYLDGLAGLGDDGYRVHYDDYVADPMVLRGLFDWLGLEFDEHRVREVLAVRHSY